MEGEPIEKGPIGIFDSGYGGLTILSKIRRLLPEYDYIYMGDNARAPYGTRSFDSVYRFTREAVFDLFDRGCRLVILACNTASAKALRTIQQIDLPKRDPSRRVLGVIRPTVEAVEAITKTGVVGVFATPGTIASESYRLEIEKIHPGFTTIGQSCPMWVPLIENNETDNAGAEFFIKKYTDELMSKSASIDTVILGCTHYPLIGKAIARHLPKRIKIIEQGEIVASSLKDYLHRHPEIETRCSKGSSIEYLTTDDEKRFDRLASYFLKEEVNSRRVIIEHNDRNNRGNGQGVESPSATN
ncbi:MAG: glutamate racemase [Muribaculaceae bacterium]|nr:glutamate racemase [Muribaculaceae bacterium]